MPFGKHTGEEIADLPDAYLEWLASRCLYSSLHDAVHMELAHRRSTGPVALRIKAGDVQLTREIVDRGYKATARVYHPDHGGNADTMRRLNVLAESLRLQLKAVEVCA